MKTRVPLIFALLIAAVPVLAGTAELQIIHNAADPAAAEVDIYVNGDRILDDFAFRTATPFLEVPSGVELNVGVAPGSSESAADILATFPVTLASGGRYLAVANGVLDPGAFAANPGGRDTGFTLFLQDHMARGSWWGTVVMRAVHGATDAPAVDIRARWTGGSWERELYSGVAYGDIGGNQLLLARDWTIDVTLPGQPDAVVASYEAGLGGLARQAFVVFASGFLSPADNQGGAAFGLFAALEDGTVIALPRAGDPMARLQVIHNAADPAAAEVDIYVNGDRLLNDFAFRAATPFIDVPAGVELVVGVAPGTSESADDVIAEFPLTLAADETYVAMATGVLDPGAFAPNPGSADIGFTIQPLVGARESGYWNYAAVVAYHGATDAPAVDIRRATRWGSRPLVRDLGYGEFSEYKWLRARSYELQVTPAGDPGTVVAAYTADLSGLRGGAAVVFASGFLDPSANNDGAAFGLFAALPDGTVLALPAAGAESEREIHAKNGDLVSLKPSLGNYPNPFNPSTTLSFSLPAESRVSLQVYDMRGRMVADVLNEVRAAGSHQVAFDGTRLASGMYMYRLVTDSFTLTERMTLLK